MRSAFSGDEGGAGSPLRRILLALVLMGIAGLAAELVLLEHVDEWTQWVPFAALAAGLLSGVAVLLRPGRATLRVFQWAMLAFVIAGAAGVVLHLRGNLEFEREMDASLTGLALFWRALRGATPALAPGSLAHLGLIGLAVAYRHPAALSHTKEKS
ncbi:hypothetical protein [Longimicrobium terrae]|uniref:Putative membrane protein n=1 Tax=Longimicrobium terrae TaxID=1639882 RepID=A0A841H5M5_9BACT|nr:hypothetical protein [Longimicrobium terrae]MBB4638947.1 putative membrane protein [Longimicrobium terrae]MBB6073186.1 putative membrane protein [Longimicrobium terrae]NNC32359.1 hypothetical protein [Longimicrobium terrae]